MKRRASPDKQPTATGPPLWAALAFALWPAVVLGAYLLYSAQAVESLLLGLAR